MKDFSKWQLKALLYVALSTLLLFLIAHINYLGESSALAYLHLYSLKIWTFLFPVICAYLLFVAYAKAGILNSLLFAPALAVLRCLYYFPYFYEYYVLDCGYTTLDSLIMSAFRSLGEFLLGFAHILLFFFVAVLVIKLMKKRTAADTTPREYVLSNTDASAFEFSVPTVAASLTVCALELAYSLAIEIRDTVTFISSAGHSMSTPELIVIIINYILIISLALIAHLLLIPKTLKKST